MSEAEARSFSEFSHYVTAQFQRVNAALVAHGQVVTRMDAMNGVIKKQERKLQELDSKIRVLEVYQSENFSNNERLFHAQPMYETIEQKISIIEKMQANILASSNQHHAANMIQESQQLMISMQRRLREIQSQIQKMRGKKGVLSKFRREISPTLVNCDSTKDISIDQSTSNQLRKVQAKMQDYINQKMKAFEKKFTALLEKEHKEEERHEETVRRRSSRVNLRESNVYQINTQPNQRADRFRKTIDQYYNQTTEKEEMPKTKKDIRISHQKNKPKHHKTPSKSKSKRKGKNNSSSKKSSSLHSVNQYLKLSKK